MRGEYGGKTLCILCGVSAMDEICRCAKELGLRTVTVSRRPDAPKPPLADAQIAADLSDGAAMLTQLREMRADAVLACAGERMIRKCVGWLSESGYRFYAEPVQWDILMNKRRFREYAAQFGIPPIPTYKAPSPADFPVVVKPTDNSGSAGISICTDPGQLPEAVSLALQHSAESEVLCEQFLSGPYFQFEIWLQDGEAFFAYSKDRSFYPQQAHSPQQPFLDWYPSANEAFLKETLFAPLCAMLRQLGIRNGSCMFQGIIHDGIPYIMDTAFRLSGGMDYLIVKAEKGADLIAAHIHYAVKGVFQGDFSGLNAPFEHAYAVLCVGLRNGTVTAVSGTNEIRSKPYVLACLQHYGIGQTVRGSGRFSQAGFRIFLQAETRAALRPQIEEVLSLLQVTDEHGNSMLLEFPPDF